MKFSQVEVIREGGIVKTVLLHHESETIDLTPFMVAKVETEIDPSSTPTVSVTFHATLNEWVENDS